jgi:hydroxymethylpyrimidine/phosphomethylpyrimidine kinase
VSAAAVGRRVLLLGGLDPSGGAGITLDATVVALHGLWPLPIAVTWTAQNRRGCRHAAAIPDTQWQAALAAAVDDGPIAAIKVGLLHTPANVAAVAEALRPFAAVPIVVDPVLSATAGGLRTDPGLPVAYRRDLLPLLTLLTPNLPELAALGFASGADAVAAGARASLVKGGHGTGPTSDDVLWLADGPRSFRRPRQPTGPVRGTGCALASAIACRLAGGGDLASACAAAGDWLADLLAALPPPEDGLPRHLPLHRAPVCRD